MIFSAFLSVHRNSFTFASSRSHVITHCSRSLFVSFCFISPLRIVIRCDVSATALGYVWPSSSREIRLSYVWAYMRPSSLFPVIPGIACLTFSDKSHFFFLYFVVLLVGVRSWLRMYVVRTIWRFRWCVCGEKVEPTDKWLAISKRRRPLMLMLVEVPSHTIYHRTSTEVVHRTKWRRGMSESYWIG